MNDKKQIIKSVVTVRRWQLGEDGLEEVVAELDRNKKESFLTINGVLQWEIVGENAEKFFNKYGLLIQENNGK